ncbi:peroxide stress protein YaaA [Algirhabdus cladophorae]|uniref:peroxide stress protein YaaA n=1 Tax=Algirhabdus cladophorae TaxID=3377108 RepID=UPI003B84826F
MLVVVSPAKKLNWDAVDAGPLTLPTFQKDATTLANTAKKLKVSELQKLMSISENLAKLNADRFKAFEKVSTDDNARPAVLAFAGDTYQGLDAASLDADAMAYAQEHLRILSGLYGLLRPLDQIQAYRLEMGSRLATSKGANLYQYWGKRLSQALDAQAAETKSDVLVNCASQEYFGAVDQKALKLRVVSPVFMEDKGNGPKIVSFFAKKARGAMARFIVENRITSVTSLEGFDSGGYAFQPDQSTEDKLVFVRDYPEA